MSDSKQTLTGLAEIVAAVDRKFFEVNGVVLRDNHNGLLDSFDHLEARVQSLPWRFMKVRSHKN